MKEILEKVQKGDISIAEAEELLRREQYADMGFAKLDLDRRQRSGFPEVIFCSGKPDNYLVSIYERMVREEGCAFGTRASQHQYELVKAAVPQAQYDPVSRILKVEKPSRKTASGGCDRQGADGHESGGINTGDGRGQNRGESSMKGDSRDQNRVDSGMNTGIGCVAVVTGGTADIPVAEEAAQTAEYFGARVERVYDVGVSGIHRLLSQTDKIRKANCVIAVAGMEGALASVVGGLVKNPVIAVPTSVGYGASMGGLSALLTMINSCANGIAVVNIDNGYGAGYIATQINRLAINGGPEKQ